MTYVIEKNIPMPEIRNLEPYPFKQMQVGDSFLIADASKVDRIRNSAIVNGRRNNRKFVVRTENGEARCWRVA